jgi:hypothetical protein
LSQKTGFSRFPGFPGFIVVDLQAIKSCQSCQSCQKENFETTSCFSLILFSHFQKPTVVGFGAVASAEWINPFEIHSGLATTGNYGVGHPAEFTKA